ncbi:MAG TPA: hypothetical protein VH083_06685 [Myxococcales bacterium]|nr:hypothetical protein [Myxococcales bacterium]
MEVQTLLTQVPVPLPPASGQSEFPQHCTHCSEPVVVHPTYPALQLNPQVCVKPSQLGAALGIEGQSVFVQQWSFATHAPLQMR